jgi:hypothetical protein
MSGDLQGTYICPKACHFLAHSKKQSRRSQGDYFGSMHIFTAITLIKYAH